MFIGLGVLGIVVALFSTWALKSERMIVRLVGGVFLALVTAGLVMALAYRAEIAEFFEIDRCLDAGGRWNYESGSCEFEPNEQ